MLDKETCEMIIERYYADIYKFCINRLCNIHAAEECAQEVFFLLFRKKDKLYFTENLRSWLFEAAIRICNKYKSKNSNIALDIDNYSDIIPDEKQEKSFSKEIYEILDKEEADLLLEYVEADHGQREKIAKRMGITTKALYRRLDRIREKVIKYLSE